MQIIYFKKVHLKVHKQKNKQYLCKIKNDVQSMTQFLNIYKFGIQKILNI